MDREWKPITLTGRRLTAVLLALGTLAAGAGYSAVARWDVRGAVWRASRGTRYATQALRWKVAGANDPVLRALANGDIRPGDRVDAVLANHPGLLVDALGRYQVLARDRDGVAGWFIVARDGRLVAAQWSSDDACLFFFGGLTAAEMDEALAGQDAGRDRAGDELWLGAMAAGGPLGHIALFKALPPEGPP